MPGQLPDYFDRRVINRRQACAELHQRLGFDPLHQMDKHIVEDADLLFIQTIRFVEEKTGHAS